MGALLPMNNTSGDSPGRLIFQLIGTNVAQRDYVGRGRSTGTQRKKNTSRSKKKPSSSGFPPLIIVLAVAVLVSFIGGLWFIAHHKKEELQEVVPHKNAGTGLPPKPEERWKYIKELEDQQTTVAVPTEPTAGGEIRSQTQLTDEQRQLLDQMAEDMRQQPTQLNEVPWNQQTPAQQQQTLRQQQSYQQQQQLQQTQRAERQQRLERQQQLARQQQAERQQRLERQQQAERQQRPERQPQAAAPITAATPSQSVPPAATPREQEKQTAAASGKRWLIQCGSFKGTAQAESARASLAFEGFESRITIGGGWNRVVIGPYSDYTKVESIVRQLRGSGHANCITLPFRG